MLAFNRLDLVRTGQTLARRQSRDVLTQRKDPACLMRTPGDYNATASTRTPPTRSSTTTSEP